MTWPNYSLSDPSSVLTSSLSNYLTPTMPPSATLRYNQPTVPTFAPKPMAYLGTPNNGADWEQMPQGTNGLAPNEGMFAGSALSNPIAAAPTGTPSFWQSMQGWMKDSGFLGSKDANGVQTQGWGGLALGGLQGIGSMYMGMQQYNLAKDTLQNSKDQFAKNFGAQASTLNTHMEDRQRARINSSNASAGYESVGDYMNKHRVG